VIVFSLVDMTCRPIQYNARNLGFNRNSLFNYCDNC